MNFQWKAINRGLGNMLAELTDVMVNTFHMEKTGRHELSLFPLLAEPH
jgi:hypothetical protein